MDKEKRCIKCNRIIVDGNSWFGLCPSCAEPIKKLGLLAILVLGYNILKKIFKLILNRL